MESERQGQGGMSKRFGSQHVQPQGAGAPPPPQKTLLQSYFGKGKRLLPTKEQR
jgi:hypothetical protein